MIEEHSCLTVEQSGKRSAAPLDEYEARETLNYRARMMGLAVVDEGEDEQPFIPFAVDREPDESELTYAELAAAEKLGVSAPRYAGVYQCRAASGARRTSANISYIVWHTPEGPPSATLGVLSGGRAGFDLYIAPDGKTYKCNDWWNYIAWQAGDWYYNQRSIGIEQGDYAGQSGNWSGSYYDKLAFLSAYAGEVCGVPIRNGSRGVPGYIDHAEITPGARTDPGRYFKRELMLQKISDYRGGRVSPPSDPTPQKPELVHMLYKANSPAQKVSVAAVEALEANGFPKDHIGHTGDPDEIRYASFRSRHGKLGQYISILTGTSVRQYLHPEATKALKDDEGEYYPPDVSDMWKATGEGAGTRVSQMRWRIAELCKRQGTDAGKTLDTFAQLLK